MSNAVRKASNVLLLCVGVVLVTNGAGAADSNHLLLAAGGMLLGLFAVNVTNSED